MIVSELGLLRGALNAVLSKEDDLVIAGELGVDGDVVSAARELRPDVTVIDLDMENQHGFRTARQLAEKVPDAAVVVLTGQLTPGVLRQALAAQVRGFASKEQPPAELTELIRRVANGDRVIDPETALAALHVADNPLTEREAEVLKLAAKGLPTRLIAGRLYLAEGTVRNHVSAILRKTGCRNRLQAVHRARDAGWL
jgi:two-component system response regulator DesR